MIRLFPRVVLWCLLTLVAGGCVGPAPEALLAKANVAVGEGDYRTASIHLRTLLQRDPTHLEGLLLLAEVALLAGDPQLAERNYRRAADLGAERDRYWFGWLESLLQLGRYGEVLARLADEIPDEAGGRAHQQWLVGRAQAGEGRSEEAEAAFRRALEFDPGFYQAHRELARLYFRAGRDAEGEAETSAALALAPADPESLLLRGSRWLAASRPEAALGDLEKARAAAARQPALQAAILGPLTEAAIQLGRLDTADEYVRSLARLAGSQAEVRYLRARILLERQDATGAKQELQEALAIERDFRPAQRLLGAIYTLENQFDLAEMYLQPVVIAAPDDLFARRLLATVHLARNRPAEALTLLDNLAAPDDEARQAVLAMAGRASLQVGDVARAISYFQEGSRQFPDNPLFELGLGLTLLAEGRTDEAQRILRQVRGTQAEPISAAFLAIASMQLGRTDEALASAQDIVVQHPEASWAHSLLGSVQLAVGRFADARSSLTTALTLDPEDGAALANLARAEQLLGDRDAAVRAWEQILARDPTNAEAAFAYARLNLERGNVSEALRVLTPFQRSSVRAQLLIASILLDRGSPEAARRLIREVIQAEPTNPEAHNLLGLAELSTGSGPAAVASLTRATDLRPTAAIYFVNLARARLVTGDEVAAAAAMESARRLDPTLPQLLSLDLLRLIRGGDLVAARRALDRINAAGRADPGLLSALEGELLLAEDRLPEAADRFATAYAARPSLELAAKVYGARRAGGAGGDVSLLADWVQRNPEDPRALRAAAEAYLAEKQYDRARGHYEKVIDLVPDDLTTLNNLAWLYQEQGDPRALRLADRAAHLAPDNAAVLDTAGWAHLQLGNRQRGMELVRRAVLLAPDNLDIQYHLAAGLMETGQVTEGREVLARIVESGEDFPSREAAERLLRRM